MIDQNSQLEVDAVNTQDNHEYFIKFLRNYGFICPREAQRIKSCFLLKQVKRKQVLLNDNDESCTKIYFVVSGILRAYFKNPNGQITTRSIVGKDQFISNMNSFRDLYQNLETIECIEDGVVLYINKVSLIQLKQEFPDLERIYSVLLEQYLTMIVRRFHFLSLENVQTKIKKFKSEYPYLIGRFSDSILASFLGVSRETFVRNKKYL